MPEDAWSLLNALHAECALLGDDRMELKTSTCAGAQLVFVCSSETRGFADHHACRIFHYHSGLWSEFVWVKIQGSLWRHFVSKGKVGMAVESET